MLRPNEPLPTLPLAVDNFQRLRTRKPSYVYVDKTSCLPELVVEGSQQFLVRPRRFGKTLLLDTIRCVFIENGAKKERTEQNLPPPKSSFQRLLCILTKDCHLVCHSLDCLQAELFKGLDITRTSVGQTLLQQELPVVFLKMNRATAVDGQRVLMKEISRLLLLEAERNGADVNPQDETPSATLARVTAAIRKKHEDKLIVFLVDEYDAPVTDVLAQNGGGMDARVKANLGVLKSFYSDCKSAAGTDFHYSLYAGVSRFASTSLFSGQNQLDDKTFSRSTASCVGFTQDEVKKYFAGYVDLLATKKSATVEDLVRQYGGYRFTAPAENLFQPWALLNRFKQIQIDDPIVDEWATQTPTWAAKLLDEKNIPEVLQTFVKWRPLADYKRISIESFQKLSVSERVALLQQCGYLTVEEMRQGSTQTEVRLSVPNQGVEDAFWRPGLNVSEDGEDNGLLMDLFKGLRAPNFGNATVYMEKLLKGAPWATAAVKAPDLIEWLSQFRTCAGWDLAEKTGSGAAVLSPATILI
eukprot:2462447-Amphidinium_carterae.2